MAESNVELLAHASSGWGKDNPAKIRDLLHPDCELAVPDSIPYGGTFRGADAVIAWFTREPWRWFDEFTSTPERAWCGAGRSSTQALFARDARAPLEDEDHLGRGLRRPGAPSSPTCAAKVARHSGSEHRRAAIPRREPRGGDRD